ncbi:MAG: diguanylate cyclase [Candidatus Gastranaerophilaceae bacterium]
MFKKIFSDKKIQTYLSYGLSFFIVAAFIVFFVQSTKIGDFLAAMENKTFDLRQSILVNSGYKKPSKNIVLVTVDDASYEYLLEKYGEWPIPRDVYAKLINYLEKQKPSVIAFDLMFVKSIKSKDNADKMLVDTIKQYKNVYTSMNFDNQSIDVRKPVNLPKKLTVNVKNDSGINFFSKDLTFSNCRAILPQLLATTKNIGLINVSRSDDGILREIPPFMVYKNDFYPHLSLLVGLKYLEKTEGLKINDFYIDKKSNLQIGKRTIPMAEDGGAILNWYGPEGTFQEVPLYKIIEAINGEGKVNFDFKNKIVYVGVTAVSLYDTKSIPVSKIYPGVELHATYVNNVLDNNFIKKVSPLTNTLISLILGLFVGIMVIRTASTFVALGTTILTAFGYIILTYYLMKFCNLWVAIVLPVTFIALIFVFAYIVKYILKSRDFEYQYKLATTDGLTELYNHRYFQEQMILQVANSKRYNTCFSLIIIDIDFFKKFNDTFGHQSGDAVLRQVAQKLKKNVRSTDVVCRYGGEEMSIILPNADKNEAISTAQKICQTISESPFKLANDKEGIVTISLGVSTYPEDGQTPGEIIDKADQRLYVAKESGRNQVRY